jgi:hypothetical protein
MHSLKSRRTNCESATLCVSNRRSDGNRRHRCRARKIGLLSSSILKTYRRCLQAGCLLTHEDASDPSVTRAGCGSRRDPQDYLEQTGRWVAVASQSRRNAQTKQVAVWPLSAKHEPVEARYASCAPPGHDQQDVWRHGRCCGGPYVHHQRNHVRKKVAAIAGGSVHGDRRGKQVLDWSGLPLTSRLAIGLSAICKGMVKERGPT